VRWYPGSLQADWDADSAGGPVSRYGFLIDPAAEPAPNATEGHGCVNKHHQHKPITKVIFGFGDEYNKWSVPGPDGLSMS
jgi:hypothetical protein